MRTFYTFMLLLMVLPAYAQKYEFGLDGGVSWYKLKTVKGANATAEAGFKLGYAAGMTLGHNMYEHIGGEVRYTYLHNDLKVASSGTEVTFGAESHVIHYDLIIHASPRSSRVRPYVAAGAGGKYYRGTGAETAFRPLQAFAIPTRTSEMQPLISAGGGVKFALSDRMWFRVDVHDFLTPFPREVLTPAPGASLEGWTHNIVPSAGLTFTF